ncbi:formimidoylglutamase [Bacillus horti]|uniref:Formimidoylglutamase n=1 Tax=Caldalkalibacillus horti TaxID=77523 RepID=A0ABT9W5C8_9BACI|nr:formimidoylglutamase [Bacillus horti]MDQ0168335.1 formiminoglutamase [Bacillus horti]
MKKGIGHILPSSEAIFVDRGVTKANQLLENWNGEDASRFGLVGLPLSKTSISASGAAGAPTTIRKALSAFTTYAIEDEIDLSPRMVTDFGDVSMHVTNLVECHQRIERSVAELYRLYPDIIPILLGGDHSISCPSLKAFAQARGRVGVIQFDAHHDLRNLEDGGPSNGTPFRGLLEAESIKGEDLIQIGIRNFSNGMVYHQYAQEQGVKVWTMKDIQHNRIEDIIAESVKSLENKVDSIYISVDMDVLDQAFAPGCPAIGPGGMDSQTLLSAIYTLAQHPKVHGMDIVEIDPSLDVRDMTSRVAAHVILQFLLGKAKAGN